MARRRKGKKTHLKGANGSAAASKGASDPSAPKSFVIRSGKVGRGVAQLVRDVRAVMEPNTASRLRERRTNKLRDFLTMCGPLGVTHLVLFSQKQPHDVKRGAAADKDAPSSSSSSSLSSWGNVNLRIARAPRGPTCTFRVTKFALASDVARSQRRPRAKGGEFATPPLLVMNNFGSQERHVKLLLTVFQNLFPPIHVHTMKLSEARRIVLLNYNPATRTIDLRHYLITVRAVGVSRRVRKAVEGGGGAQGGLGRLPTPSSTAAGGGDGGARSGRRRGVVNLAQASDIADWILGRPSSSSSPAAEAAAGGFDGRDGTAAASEAGTGVGYETDASSTAASDAEGDSDVDEATGQPRSHVELPSRYLGRGNVGGTTRAVRLRELGPRMEMRCLKIEQGIPGAGKRRGEAEGGNEVLWHDYVQKSSKETAQLERRAEERRAEREARREAQEANVARKREERAAARREARLRQGLPAEDGREGGTRRGAGDDGPGGSEEEEEEARDEEEEDEFDYEDRFGGGEAAAYKPRVVAGDGSASVALSAAGDLFDVEEEGEEDDGSIRDEDDEEADDDDDEDDDDGDSDLSPIPVGRTRFDDDIDGASSSEDDDDDDEAEWEEATDEDGEEDESDDDEPGSSPADVATAAAAAASSSRSSVAKRARVASPPGRGGRGDRGGRTRGGRPGRR